MAAPRAWTEEEDDLLRSAVAEHGDGPGVWKTVAERIPGRTNKACRKRWLHSLSPTVKKTPWTSAEDALLLKYYAVHSPPRWSFIAKHILGRTDDACAKRYREALDPSLKREEWTPEEEALLLQLTTQLGSKWTQVGQAMGRSGLACRNRWRLLERKQRPKRRDHPADADPSHAYPVLHAPSFPSDPEFLLFPAHPLPSVPPLALPVCISSISSLSNALVHSSGMGQEYEPSSEVTASPSFLPPNSPHRDSTPYDSYVQPSPSPSPSPEYQAPEASTEARQEEDSCPRVAKRPRLRRLHGREQTRLSSHLPADVTRSILPYACGHSRCWPPRANPDPVSPACFTTAAELAEHRRIEHGDDPNTEGKPFRCALEGCGKGWKNINGIQYHLQISKAHFQQAIGRFNTAHPPSDPNSTMPKQPSAIANERTRPTMDPALPDSTEDANTAGSTAMTDLQHQNASPDNTTTSLPPADSSTTRAPPKRPYKRRPPKQLACPHEGCPNVYKQLTGLQYHLAHGHPSDLAQLDVVPPVLMRKVQGAV